MKHRIKKLAAGLLAFVCMIACGVLRTNADDETFYPPILLETPRVTQSSMGCVVASLASAEAYLYGTYEGVTYRFGQDYAWNTPIYFHMLKIMNATFDESGYVESYTNMPPAGWRECWDISLKSLYKNLLLGKPLVLWSDGLGHASLLIGYAGPTDHLEESGFIVMDVFSSQVQDLSVLSHIADYTPNSCYRSLTQYLYGNKLSHVYAPVLSIDRTKVPVFCATGALSVSETNAVLWEKHVTGPFPDNYSERGFYIGTNQTSLQKYAEPSAKMFEESRFDLNETFGKLRPGTAYYYRMFFIFGGKEYQSEIKSFRTKGTPSAAAPVIAGDADGNGVVDSTDMVLIARYLAKWDISISQPAAVELDNGKLTAKVAAVVARYLAKWKNGEFPIGEKIFPG